MMNEPSGSSWTLDDQREAFAKRRFLAMPLAGTIAWAAIGAAGAFLSDIGAAWAVFIGTGSIFYLAVLIARFTGEDLLGKKGPKNFFNHLFLLTVVMAVLVYAIAIPFFLVDYTSLPMTVGILTGLMWIPFGGMIQHWVGLFHGLSRTVLVLAAWYVFPDHRFVAIPAVIVALYLVTIWVLESRELETDVLRQDR